MSGKAALSGTDFWAQGGIALMAWARIDDAFDDHPKVLAVLEHEQGGAAIGLWTLCLTWAHRNTLRKGKTPGLISASLPRRYLGPGARELAALLVKEGLWEPRDEGDGWLIHDFGNYLPTPKTREARAAAGRKGAAKRWASGGRDDGSEPGNDGNLPSGQGNEPDSSHDADNNAMTSDGSRAPAHRAIPNGIAPVPAPVPPTAGAGKPRARRPAKPRATAPNAGEVVAAYVDGALAATLPRPDESLRKRVGKQAGEIMARGTATFDALLTAAWNMGAIGWNDLAVQLQRDAAAAKGSGESAADQRMTEIDRLREQDRQQREGGPSKVIQGRAE